MQQKNSAGNFFTDMQATMKQMMENAPGSYPVDLKTILEAQRKNVQALTEANKRAMQGWQALAMRQAEMVTDFMQGNSGLARETFSDTAPEEKLARQADLIKNSYETSVNNAQELVEMMTKCTKDAAEVINRRITASFGEVKNSAKKDD